MPISPPPLQQATGHQAVLNKPSSRQELVTLWFWTHVEEAVLDSSGGSWEIALVVAGPKGGALTTFFCIIQFEPVLGEPPVRSGPHFLFCPVRNVGGGLSCCTLLAIFPELPLGSKHLKEMVLIVCGFFGPPKGSWNRPHWVPISRPADLISTPHFSICEGDLRHFLLGIMCCSALPFTVCVCV